MKVIFLEIDGVLNNEASKSSCDQRIGIDNDKVKRLKKIVEDSKAEIVLISNWRLGSRLEDKYLKKKLSKEHMHWVSTTPNLNDEGKNRETEIKQWLENNSDINIEKWIVIDSEMVINYHDTEITKRLVKTEFHSLDGGLQEEHIAKAIELLR